MSFASYLSEDTVNEMPMTGRVLHLKNKGKIDDIMETLKIDPVVKATAEKYYYQLSVNTIRPEAKLKAVFYCVLAAQETLRDQISICSAKDLGSELNLNNRQQVSAIKKFQGRLKLDHNIIGYVPMSYCVYSKAKNYWDKEVLEDIMYEWGRIIAYRPTLENCNPDRIVSAFLYYYINSRGYKVDIDELLKQFKDVKYDHLITNERMIVDIATSMRRC